MRSNDEELQSIGTDVLQALSHAFRMHQETIQRQREEIVRLRAQQKGKVLTGTEMAILPLTYGVAEAARELQISERLFRKLMRQGVIPYIKIGGRVVVRRATLEQLLEEFEQRVHPRR
jgi:excisionase family DNA binding protein